MDGRDGCIGSFLLFYSLQSCLLSAIQGKEHVTRDYHMAFNPNMSIELPHNGALGT